MVRLPQAKTRALQTVFREIRERLPKLFSAEEHIQHIRDLHSLLRQATVMAHEPCGSCCHLSSLCDGSVHAQDQYYEEIAE
jgi:hypothetical protein